MAERPPAEGDRNAASAGDNRPALSLHVPEPKYRPGDAVDFSHIQVPEAGAQARPDETVDPDKTYFGPLGRPVPIVDGGKVIEGLT